MTKISMGVLEEIRKRLEDTDADGLCEMVRVLAEALIGAEVDGLCGAGHGERSPDRVDHRNRYRTRCWDTRAGSIDLQIPKLRKRNYFPELLSDRHDLVTSAVAVVEVVRAARRVATSPALIERAHDVTGAMHLLAVDREVLDRAAELEPATLRALDAIHLASALSLGTDLEAMVVYDRRLAEAAESFGLHALAPR